jgi:hypothetical protein
LNAGAGSGVGVLLDDRRHPSLRSVVGKLLARATTADFAIARVRLAAVDLTSDELANVQRCRVLLGRLDVDALAPPDAGAAPDPIAAARLLTLHAFLTSGRVEVHTAGSTLWVPDFSILGGMTPSENAPTGAVCLIGAHYFARPYPTRGPALTCLLSERGSVASAKERFDELWDMGYDVLPVIAETLEAMIGVG